jgi:CBS domain-containing protein
MVPPTKGALFEMIPAEVVFELAVLLLDGPATSGQRHHHLPVLEADRMIGLVSIGDVVEAVARSTG